MRRPAPQYRGVVFDLDGTLLDTMPGVLEGLARAVTPYRPRPDRREVLASLGGPSDVCLFRLLGGRRQVAAALAAYQHFLEEHEERARLFPGARRLVGDLDRAGIPLGLWTGRERRLTLARLRGAGLDRHFDVLVCGDDLASHKPDPAGIRRIVRRWKLKPSQVLFVGDTQQDLDGGRAAGVAVVAIHPDPSLAPPLRGRPEMTTASPAEAYAWVRAAVLDR